MPPIDPYRLPRWITPRHYALTLRPDLDTATFDGRAVISAEVVETTDQIVLNSHELGIEAVTVTSDAGVTSVVTGWTLDVTAQRLLISLAEPVEVGRVVIDIEFTGSLNDQLVGFYRSTYTDDSGSHVIATTQFEAPHARQAFPCWDEPDRKATYGVTLEVPSELFAVSNAAEVARTDLGDGLVAVTFADTMVMSTYLVAFAVGRLVATEPIAVNGTPVRVICRPGMEHLAATALDVARHSIEFFEDYYGIAYPGDKMDLVAVPDFAFGAMENLGCITFREILLLGDPDEMAQAELERLALVVAHEIAHMWFGDLVTMSWWEGIWLNEAFATFMETICVDAYRPDWNEWTRFGLARAEAFETDALVSTRPIEYVVETPADAEGMFDVLTYEKGGAVLRMLEQYLGPDTFRDGVRRYLKQHSYSNTVTTDLWDAIEAASGEPVREIMNSWILQGGHPLVRVDVDDESGVTLSQSRMSFAGVDNTLDGTWTIPVVLRDGDDVTHRVLLGSEPVSLGAMPLPIQPNADGVGFYRSSLPAGPRDELLAHVDRLGALERFVLLDDAWALVLGDRAELADAITAARALASDTSASVWRSIAGLVTALRRLGGAAHRDAVASFTRSLTGVLLGSITEIDSEVAGIVWRLAGSSGADPSVIERSLDWVSDPTGVDPELRAASIDVVATHGDLATFQRFLTSYRDASTPQDERRYLNALTRFDNPAAAAEFLALAATEIRTQDAPYQLSLAMGNAANGAAAWQFVAAHWDELLERFPSNSIVRMVSGVRSLYEPESTANVLEFFETHQIPQAKATLAQHLEIVRVHAALVERVRSSVSDSLS